MKCIFCGAPTDVKETRSLFGGYVNKRTRLCWNGCERFATYEIQATVASHYKSKIPQAIRANERRAACLRTYKKIHKDPRPAADVADEYGITRVRVNQIRARMRAKEK